MAKVFLGYKKGLRVEDGHPWVYKNEIENIEGDFEPGDIVEVYNYKGKFIGKGYINPKSQITIRIMTREKDEEINEDFFRRRILDAWNYRKKVIETTSCRVVFGEADFIPALIVDKFSDYLVVQFLSLGIERWKDTIVKVLKEVLNPKGIYERSDVPVRELEGLEQRKGFLTEPFDTTIISEENGVKYYVDIENGQKTGYFLDQKENRYAIKDIVKDADVLDCFCHTGSFSLHAGHFGAKSVLGIDVSEHAVEFARRNAKLNGLENICKFEAHNAFDVLKTWAKEGRKYDVVILDPPAFTKSRSAVEGAVRGYKEINLRALKMVKKGGYLVTCSCSHFMYPELFMEVVMDAARDAKRTLRLVEYRNQSKDHPVLFNSDETLYLKFMILQVI
ncbi:MULTISPECIES: class I SAM-dependent rRNA methyltransferase [Caloramator]|uniref:23S rRNA (Cytosine1962-C5)-methyltransferase n=1 Tax=Caloramator proteoclasticus DSM 10124 TaxID=1121262 RepID=A0A1M5AA16_9CLOT|nr:MULTISPECIES: class I SAM-dependent rRNA methyltransferase [Caloramator]SHF27109.1 23S rRNA (cytosine1962-C5)-methyltransferase [Caloramator proteoclasticus DSM 10124]